MRSRTSFLSMALPAFHGHAVRASLPTRGFLVRKAGTENAMCRRCTNYDRIHRACNSGAENHSAETAKRKREVNAADHRHRDEVKPDDGKISTAIQNGLREGDEMWGRANYPH